MGASCKSICLAWCVTILAIIMTLIIIVGTMSDAEIEPTYTVAPTDKELDELIELAVDHHQVNQWYREQSREEVRAGVRKLLYARESWCNSLASKDSYEFCTISVGINLLREWKTLKEGVADAQKNSKWEETNDFQLRYMLYDKEADYFPPNNPTRWKHVVDAVQNGPDHDWVDGQRKHDKLHKKTTFPGPRGTWHVERVGPFYHKGDDEWHHVWFDAFNDLTNEGPDHIGKWTIGSLMSVVTPDGEIIGYPPAHMHHFHLYQKDRLAPYSPFVHILGTETHGDASCEQDGLGALCYMQQYPRGYGLFAAESYFFDSLVNFVRPARDTENGDEFWFQAAIYVADEVPVNGFTIPLFAGISDFNPLQQPEAHTFRVPANGDQAVNWEISAEWMMLPFDVEMVWWKWHSHWYFTKEFQVYDVAGGPASIGLDKEPFISKKVECQKAENWPYASKPAEVSHPNENFCDPTDSPIPATNVLGHMMQLKDTGLTIEDVKWHVTKNLIEHRRQTGEGALLFESPKTADFKHEIPEPDGSLHTFWSRPMVKPAYTDLKAGTRLTVLGGYEPTDGIPEWVPEDGVRMHLKNVMFTKPKSPFFRYVVSGHYSRTLSWYVGHNPGAILGFIVVFVLFWTFHLAQYCKIVSGEVKPATETAATEAPHSGKYNKIAVNMDDI